MKRVLWLGGMVLLYVLGTWVAVLEVREYPDHSAPVLFRWASFYFFAAVLPFIWGVRVQRELRTLGIADPARVGRFVIGPVIVGWLTFLSGVRLISGY